MLIKGTHANGTRLNTDMRILENPMDWVKKFQAGWLAHLEETGEYNWEKYARPRNTESPSGSGITLAESRIMLISTAGAYVTNSQEGFQEDSDTGDYTTRLIPSRTELDDITFSKSHYDQKPVKADPQVLLPLRHMETLRRKDVIGEVSPVTISYNGYQPDVLRVVKELIPDILDIAFQYKVDGAFLVPAGPLCIQSVGLVARALEINGIASVLTSWNTGLAQITAPPRYTVTTLKRGSTLGAPSDDAQQLRVIEASLALLEKDSPLEMVELKEAVRLKV